MNASVERPNGLGKRDQAASPAPWFAALRQRSPLIALGSLGPRCPRSWAERSWSAERRGRSGTGRRLRTQECNHKGVSVG